MNIKFPDNEIAQDENMIREYSNCLINQIKILTNQIKN